MQKRRRLGRGLEDISHYFISQDRKKGDSTSLIEDEDDEIRYQVVSIVDLFEPRRSALFTSRIGIELCNHGIRTLVIDTDTRFPSIALMLGLSIPGYLFRHYFQEQYYPADIIYTGSSGLKLLAPRLSIKEICKMKTPDIVLMLKALISIEKEIDIVILRQNEDNLQSLIEEAVFIIPAFCTSMIRVYREVKSFVAGAERKRIGIVITDAADELAAVKAYEKISRCIEMSCGVKPYFCGYLSDISTFSTSSIIGHISKVAIENRETVKGRRLFFDRLRSLVGVDSLTDEEIANLLN